MTQHWSIETVDSVDTVKIDGFYCDGHVASFLAPGELALDILDAD